MKSSTTSSRGYLPCVPSSASVLFSLLFLLPCGAWAQSLGAYPNTSVVAGQNTTVIPAAAPTNTVRATVGTNTNFTGVLTVNPTTGDVRVTDAKQAGVYMVTVTAFGSGSATATATFTLTVTNPACSAGNFGGTTTVGVGLGPGSVAIGDFNGDGRQDFATANAFSNNVSIRLGDGLGGFSGSTTVGVGSGPLSVAIGDFNGDGVQDFATANAFSNNVSICLGDGLGGFSGTMTVGVGAGPYSVAIGDFNGDGRQDFATANENSDNVSIRLGDGLGGFSGTTTVGVGDQPYSVAIGDFNGDGRQDFATANALSDNVSIRLGDGLGGFSGSTTVGVGDGPFSVAIGDFNGDGRQDFATANVNSDNVSIRLGDGLGGFSGTTTVGVGDKPAPVAIGDFNGDGVQDFATANFFGPNNDVSIRLGVANEINLRGNGVDIADDDNTPSASDHTDFGSTTGMPITRTFTIQNIGNADLSLGAGAITINGPDALLFSVSNITLPATVNGPNGSITFDVTYTPVVGGAHTAEINIANNDCDENPYNFAVMGMTFLLSVEGNIKWSTNQTQGVKSATVNVSGDGTGSGDSDADGNYSVNLSSGGNITITPTKNINKFNGVTAADATRIQQHVTGNPLLGAPYPRIAADVNKNNAISVQDASLIKQALLGNQQANAQWNTSWRFVDADHVFPNPNAPWNFPESVSLTGVDGPVTDVNFTGVKLGDVTTPAANPALRPEPVVLRSADQVLQAGQSVAVPVTVEGFIHVAAYQFVLHFDPELLALEHISTPEGGLLSLQQFGTYQAADGEIRSVFSQAEGSDVDNGAVFFTLHFMPQQSGARLSDAISLDASLLPAEAYTPDIEVKPIELAFSQSSATGQPNAPRPSLRAQPNPAAGYTQLHFTLPVADEALLRVLDLNGKVLLEQRARYDAGAHVLPVSFSRTGVYTAELRTAKGIELVKIVVE